MPDGYRTKLEGKAVEFARGLAGTVYPPERRGSLWVVRAVDVLGETAEKLFATKDRALDFYTSVWLGMNKGEAAKAADPDAPGLDNNIRRGHVQLHEAIGSGSQATHQAQRKDRKGINFRKVAEVLEGYGLDPAETVAEVLQPVTVVDPDTGLQREEHRLDAAARASVALELLQYTRPKLKAVEMKVEGTLSELSQEQIDAKIKRYVAQAAAGTGEQA